MCLSSGSKTQAPPPVVTPAPEPIDTTKAQHSEAVKRAKDAEAAKQRLAQGREDTILTGKSGLTDTATTKKKTLLGE